MKAVAELGNQLVCQRSASAAPSHTVLPVFAHPPPPIILCLASITHPLPISITPSARPQPNSTILVHICQLCWIPSSLSLSAPSRAPGCVQPAPSLPDTFMLPRRLCLAGSLPHLSQSATFVYFNLPANCKANPDIRRDTAADKTDSLT